MITENYVSFEIAKLLRDKEFNEHCYTYYDDIDDTINRFDKGYHFNNTSYPWGVPYDVNKAKKYVVAPTLQMAMKWLREVHNLFIQICIIPHTTVTIEQKYYFFTIHKDRRTLAFRKDFPREYYFTYEEACEAAIKYCLEDLI